MGGKKNIFNKYPELLRIRVLRDNSNSVNAAMTYLTTIPEEDVMYVKILRPRDETAVRNRNNFALLSSAAHAVGQVEVTSMKFYRGGNQEGIGSTLANIIRQYLSFRLENVHMSITGGVLTLRHKALTNAVIYSEVSNGW
jgi:hypothetical protein